MEKTDVAVIGAGISGCAAAYELALAGASVTVLEQGGDVAAGATRANSAIVHSGYDPAPGTAMAKYNLLGSLLLQKRAAEWNFPYKRVGSLTVAFGPEQAEVLQELLLRGEKNKVEGLSLLSSKEAYLREPALAPGVSGALLAETCAIVGPWELALCHAENARAHGAAFYFNRPVTGLQKTADGWLVQSPQGEIKAKVVLSAAGAFAAEVLAMAGGCGYTVSPVKGEYFLLDKSAGETVRSVVFSLPSEKGKGVLIAPTVHGNLIVGPSADAAAGPGDTASTSAGLAEVRAAAERLVPKVPLSLCIRNFAGVRARSSERDFILGEAARLPGFYQMAGMQSPGLTAAPAAAKAVAAEICHALHLPQAPEEESPLFRWPTPFWELEDGDRQALLRQDKRYGRVICRCETVTEGEIVRALQSPLTPASVGGVKRRCGAGLGRCQGGFCGPRVQEIIARERGLPLEAVVQEEAGSWLLTGPSKGGAKA